MEEEWRDIKGYEGLYQVSNLGRVKVLGNGNSNNSKQRIKKLSQNQKSYLQVQLSKNGILKMFSVHRLVALTFLDNPNNLPEINHKDENKQNNCVNNLEWCDRKYNVNYGTRNEKISTKIKCLDLETNELSYYPSIREAARHFNIHSTVIHRSIYKYNSPFKNRFIFSEIKNEED